MAQPSTGPGNFPRVRGPRHANCPFWAKTTHAVEPVLPTLSNSATRTLPSASSTPRGGSKLGPAATTSLEPGARLLDRYVLVEELGHGGMGYVYRAYDEVLATHVALKVVPPDRPALREGLVHEARILAQLGTEHVPKVMNFGELSPNGASYMVLEYLEGQDLRQHLDQREGPLGVQEAVDHVLEACVALAVAHRAQVFHRDIKPANLFVSRRSDGTPIVKLLDFGIARDEGHHRELALAKDSPLLGSPAFMAPEQMRDAATADARSDIWSLSVVLFELCSGQPPFVGDSLPELVEAVLHAPPRPLPDFVPAELRQVLQRGLEKAPDDRHPSIGQLASELAPWAGERGLLALRRLARLDRNTSALVRTLRLRPTQRSPWPRLLGFAVVLVALAALVGWLHEPGATAPPTTPQDAPR